MSDYFYFSVIVDLIEPVHDGGILVMGPSKIDEIANIEVQQNVYNAHGLSADKYCLLLGEEVIEFLHSCLHSFESLRHFLSLNGVFGQGKILLQRQVKQRFVSVFVLAKPFIDCSPLLLVLPKEHNNCRKHTS